MVDKLVFSAGNAESGRKVVDMLKAEGVDESRISVIGKDAQPIEDMPDPGEFENDVVPGSKRGALVGGATGLLAGLGAIVIAPGLALGGAALALATAGGATFGVLASSLIGSSVPNSQLREYEEAIARGEVLMVVELEEGQRSSELRARLQQAFPELTFHGEIDAVPPVV
ncbi:hypothetical protein ACUNV4_02520 [Granulosicoccus sp. 3-233]|uniref:hypothetical protein n=1 Tax=Granulosicoccus sp. 3-233 TaxID=3417969 RepID=UPI003D348BA3